MIEALKFLHIFVGKQLNTDGMNGGGEGLMNGGEGGSRRGELMWIV